MLLFDFSAPAAIGDWVAINDAVMGGVSRGALEAAGPAAVFSGSVSLDNGGGFASVRSRPRDLGLAGYAGLELHIHGDGRRYKINLKTDRRTDGLLYAVRFDTRAGQWETLRLAFEDFLPSFRGRRAAAAPPLDPSRVTSLGLMISDRQAGPFCLKIARITAYAR